VAVNVYEGMFILDANRYSRDTAAVSGHINELIRKHGGEMLASRLWEERRLAYPIEGHRKGAYWLTYFRVETGQISKITRECQLSDTILRSLILKIDPRIADALVEHARSDRAAAEKAAAEKAAAKAAESKAAPAEPAEAAPAG
jgi:small subunit ribosomal protein S6